MRIMLKLSEDETTLRGGATINGASYVAWIGGKDYRLSLSEVTGTENDEDGNARPVFGGDVFVSEPWNVLEIKAGANSSLAETLIGAVISFEFNDEEAPVDVVTLRGLRSSSGDVYLSSSTPAPKKASGADILKGLREAMKQKKSPAASQKAKAGVATEIPA